MCEISQGSENETIVYVVGDSLAQKWKHIYTAVTRGQKRVYVVSKKQAIRSAIETDEIKRQTRLSSLVKSRLVRPSMLVGTPEAQPNTPRRTPTGRLQQATPPCTLTTGRSTLPQRKRLHFDNDGAKEAVGDNVCGLATQDKEQRSTAMSAGHKRQRMSD